MVLTMVLTACQGAAPISPAPTSIMELTLTATLPAPTPIIETSPNEPTKTVETVLEVYDPAKPDSWVYLPVIPETLSQRVRDLYETGKTNGLDQQAFSKVGDCETFSPYFLAPFDMNKNGYRLGAYSSLDTVITAYAGSFKRTSQAAKSGFSVASVLSPVWADPAACRSGETPLVCEIRIQRPAIMLVMFGTNDVKTSSREGFEAYLKRLLDIALLNNVVPVLVTKADNLEGDNSINAIIARVAYEYELPVLNLWRAMQDLPDGGMMPDQIHLTYTQPFFDEPANMLMGWPVRNLVTLQMLEFLHNELE
jgi:hypothetical protein